MTSANASANTQQTHGQTTTGPQTIFSLTQLRQEIEAELAGQPILGWMITYSIRQTIISLADLTALLAKHNIQGVDVKPVREATYLQRALKSLAKLQKDQVIHKVADDSDRLVYVVGELEADDIAETLGLKPGMKVRINRKATNGQDPLEFETRADDEALRPIIAKYADAWTSRDLSDKVMKAALMSKRSFRGREDGGVYFLFASEVDTLMSLLGFCQDLAMHQHNGSYLTYVPISDLHSAKRNLARHAHDTVEAELRQMEIDLARFEDEEARGKARPKTIGDMLFHIKETLDATDLYADRLEFNADGVRRHAARVRTMAQAVLLNQSPSAAGKQYDTARAWEQESVQQVKAQQEPAEDDAAFADELDELRAQLQTVG